jgi:ribose transport system substrate-binding protein
MKMKNIFIAAMMVLAMLTLNACTGKTGDGGTGRKKIGVSLLARTDVFYRDMEDAMKEAAEKGGFDLIIQSGDKDLSKQQSQIENFIVQKVDAIILCPTDTQGIAPAIERANKANIPVFTADIAAGGGLVISHIASDNIKGGRLAGEYVVQALQGKGKVGILGHPEVQSVIDRENGFKEAVKSAEGITLIPTIAAGGKRDRALKAAEDLIQGNPDIKAIFCINDETALGALSVVESRGLKDVIIVGFDAAPEAVEKIKAGTALKADVAQQPKEIGRMAVEAVAKHLRGEAVEKTIAVPVTLVQ